MSRIRDYARVLVLISITVEAGQLAQVNRKPPYLCHLRVEDASPSFPHLTLPLLPSVYG